jgi:hypothetical protein
VAIGCAIHPIPSRTRPLSAQPLMVLRPKTRESKSPPDLTRSPLPPHPKAHNAPQKGPPDPTHLAAGWSSPVARQAHNLKAAGSNPAPATKNINGLAQRCARPFLLVSG